MSLRIAVNGVGRIGRCAIRAIHERHPDVEIVAVNDVADAESLVRLLRHDSVYGRFPASISLDGDVLSVGDRQITVFGAADASDLPWADLGVDIVLECSGRLRTRAKASAHLEAGAPKVIVSAPVSDPDVTLCLGVNHSDYDPARHDVISNASCTTNCLAPVAKVLDETFGIERGFMTTCHAYTSDQRLLDAPHKDPRRARAAALSIIPTSTGAARAIGLVLPALRGRLDGIALRVPVPDGSVVDLTCELREPVTREAVNAALAEAAAGPLDGIMMLSDEPLVSTDVIGDPHSSIVDGLLTMANGSTVKLVSWYDNEWAYTCRMLELAELVGASLPERAEA